MKSSLVISGTVILICIYSAVGFSQDVNQGNLILQGGDNIYDAYPIMEIPFGDSGTTVGYTDDYSGNCGYDNNAPDVVYSLTTEYNLILQAFLCWESEFDTRLYVFQDNPYTIIACNDDYCTNQYSNYVSALECLELPGGHTYYFVIDGYGSASGNYDFILTPPPPGVSLAGNVSEYGDGPLGGVDIRAFQDDSIVWQDTTYYNGDYYVIYLPPGWYTVEASKAGFIPQTSAPVEVTLCTQANADFVLQRTGPPPIGAIAGIVTDSVSADPIDGALMRAFYDTTYIFYDTTNASGYYCFPEMQTVPHFIEASKTGYITRIVSDINVFADETTWVNIALSPAGLICEYIPGDANGNGTLDGLDVIYSVNYLKGFGPIPPDSCDCYPYGILLVAADANGNCSYNGLDVTYSVNYLKGLGPAPIGCPDCPPARM